MNNRTVSLSFSVGDLPMIASAFMIARNTALMCGNKVAKERLAAYLKTINELIPEDARLFDPEEWAEICAGIQTCKEWSITIGKAEWDRHSHHTSGGRIRVRVDGEAWLSGWGRSRSGFVGNFTVDSQQYLAIKALLEEMSGLESQQVPE